MAKLRVVGLGSVPLGAMEEPGFNQGGAGVVVVQAELAAAAGQDRAWQLVSQFHLLFLLSSDLPE